MTAPIADTDTLEDVLPLLRDPEEQVRKVLDTMWQHKARSPVVRIGRRGNGSYPCYRIVAGDGEVLGAFNDNGTPFKTSDGAVNWCTGEMDMAAVGELRQRIRDAKKRPRYPTHLNPFG